MSYFDYDEEYAPKATMSEAHSEWHRNSGVPMGTPGCPQDACHWDDEPDREPTPADEEGWDAREEWIRTPFFSEDEPPF